MVDRRMAKLRCMRSGVLRFKGTKQPRFEEARGEGANGVPFGFAAMPKENGMALLLLP